MVRKNYSEEQEKMARFAKAMGHPAHFWPRRNVAFLATFMKNCP